MVLARMRRWTPLLLAMTLAFAVSGVARAQQQDELKQAFRDAQNKARAALEAARQAREAAKKGAEQADREAKAQPAVEADELFDLTPGTSWSYSGKAWGGSWSDDFDATLTVEGPATININGVATSAVKVNAVEKAVNRGESSWTAYYVVGKDAVDVYDEFGSHEEGYPRRLSHTPGTSPVEFARLSRVSVSTPLGERQGLRVDWGDIGGWTLVPGMGVVERESYTVVDDVPRSVVMRMTSFTRGEKK